MMRRLSSSLLAGTVIVGCAATAAAKPGDWVNGVLPVAKPVEPTAIPLPVTQILPNPDAEGWARQDPSQRQIYNVSHPTITPMPASMGGTAPEAAVILVPGGGFQFLAIDNEGYDVASRLAPLGVRVFILKYRTQRLLPPFNAAKGPPNAPS